MFMFQHLWLVGAVWVGGFGALMLRRRLTALAATGDVTPREAQVVPRNYLLCVALPCVAMWGLQQSIGAGTEPMFFLWPGPQRLAAAALLVLVWGAGLYWLFARDGAEKVLRYGLLQSRGTSWQPSAKQIRLAALAALVVNLVVWVPTMLAPEASPFATLLAVPAPTR